jgi:polysaccharide biosynthesis protein PelF
VKDLGIDDAVRFEGRVNVTDWMPRIDILVLTSLSEAQPLVILEAGACGIPAVAPDVGSCRELIEGRRRGTDPLGGIVTGLVNPDDTAQAILRLLRDPPARRAMGQALQERVLSDYDRSTIISQYRKIYEELGTAARFPELQ